MNILLIDDDPSLRKSLRLALETMGHNTTEADDSGQAQERLAHGLFDVAFLDLRLGREQGLDLLPLLLRLAPGLKVVIITAYATIETAVEAMRRGACDYLPKPFTPDQLRQVLGKLIRPEDPEIHAVEMGDHVRSVVPEVDLRTEDPTVKAAQELAIKAAASDATVLIRGESGTGKAILARLIHAHSLRSAAPFVTVECPSRSAELLESELFGHVRGAFPGAVSDAEGKVATAKGGTLFLDEVGDLPLSLQTKLVSMLQEKRYERVGETRTRAADVRILAATNRDLATAVTEGRFRKALFYRLNVVEVVLPPLRERRRDILPLADHLLRFFAAQAGKSVTKFTSEAHVALEGYHWPGNIRELRNFIERGVLVCTGEKLGLADLPTQLVMPPPATTTVGGAVTLEQLEAEHIRRVLNSAASLEEAATILGINPSTLYRKRKRLVSEEGEEGSQFRDSQTPASPPSTPPAGDGKMPDDQE